MTADNLFSRGELVDKAGLDNVVLTFWLRHDLLESKGAGARKHKRFTMDEARIAAVLNEAREQGLNIAALKAAALAMRASIALYRDAGRDTNSRFKNLELQMDQGADRSLWDTAMVGASLLDCAGVLALYRNDEQWLLVSLSSLDAVPFRSAVVFDLQRILDGFDKE